MPLEPEMLELLLAWCTVKSKGVDFNFLLDLMNWKLDIDLNKAEAMVNSNTEQQLRNENDVIKEHIYNTSSKQTRAVVGELSTTGNTIYPI